MLLVVNRTSVLQNILYIFGSDKKQKQRKTETKRRKQKRKTETETPPPPQKKTKKKKKQKTYIEQKEKKIFKGWSSHDRLLFVCKTFSVNLWNKHWINGMSSWLLITSLTTLTWVDTQTLPSVKISIHGMHLPIVWDHTYQFVITVRAIILK